MAPSVVLAAFACRSPSASDSDPDSDSDSDSVSDSPTPTGAPGSFAGEFRALRRASIEDEAPCSGYGQVHEEEDVDVLSSTRHGCEDDHERGLLPLLSLRPSYSWTCSTGRPRPRPPATCPYVERRARNATHPRPRPQTEALRHEPQLHVDAPPSARGREGEERRPHLQAPAAQREAASPVEPVVHVVRPGRRATTRSRVVMPRAVNARGPSSARVRSMPRRRAGEGRRVTVLPVRWPASSRVSVTSAVPALPNGTVAHTASALAACGNARVKIVARSVAKRSARNRRSAAGFAPPGADGELRRRRSGAHASTAPACGRRPSSPGVYRGALSEGWRLYPRPPHRAPHRRAPPRASPPSKPATSDRTPARDPRGPTSPGVTDERLKTPPCSRHAEEREQHQRGRPQTMPGRGGHGRQGRLQFGTPRPGGGSRAPAGTLSRHSSMRCARPAISYGARVSMQRKAGVVLPLFSIRTRRDWGIGQISDLPACAAWLRRAGQRLLQILPPHELSGGETSPYGALTAFGLDPIYVDVDAIEDLDPRAIDDALGDEGKHALEKCRAAPSVAYPEVRALKMRALRAAFDRFRAREMVARDAPGPPPRRLHPPRARLARRPRALRDAARVAQRLGVDDVARAAAGSQRRRARRDPRPGAEAPPRGRLRAVDPPRAVGARADADA